jgi:hypothetical protein
MNHAIHEDPLAEDLDGLRATVLECRVKLCEASIRAAFLASALERIAALRPAELDAGPALARGALTMSLGR